jgi:hypothetical protein
MWAIQVIAGVTTNGTRTIVTVRQDGQMPSPVVLKVQFAASGPALKRMANAKMVDATTAIVTWPVDVWFNGNRTFQATLDFGRRAISAITLDPDKRFPDRNPDDNVWPKTSKPTTPPTAASARRGSGDYRASPAIGR